MSVLSAPAACVIKGKGRGCDDKYRRTTAADKEGRRVGETTDETGEIVPVTSTNCRSSSGLGSICAVAPEREEARLLAGGGGHLGCLHK